MEKEQTVSVIVKEVTVWARNKETGEIASFKFISPSKRVSLAECQEQCHGPNKAMDFDIEKKTIEIPFDILNQFI